MRKHKNTAHVACEHRLRNVAKWRDTAGLLWHEDECQLCGRLWRYRIIGFTSRAANLLARKVV